MRPFGVVVKRVLDDEAGAITILRTLVEETTAEVIALAESLLAEFEPRVTSPNPDLVDLWNRHDSAVNLPSPSLVATGD